MAPSYAAPESARTEIRQLRAQLRDVEQRRDTLLVETAALKLWEEAPAEGRVPRWVAEAAIRRRQAESDELGLEIGELVRRIATLCDQLPDNVHGTPSLELEPVPTLVVQDESGASAVNRILISLNRARTAPRTAGAVTTTGRGE